MKLQSKIIFIVILLSFVAHVIFVASFIFSSYSRAINRLDEKIEYNSILLNQINSTPLYDMNEEKLETNLKSFLNDPEIISISLEEIDGPIELYSENPHLTKKNIIKKEVNIFYKGEKIGVVRTVYTREILERNIIKSVLRIIASFILIIITISIALVLFLRRVIRPITDLTELSIEIASGNLDKEINIVSNDEIGTLTKSFTQMQNAIREKMAVIHESKEELYKTHTYITNVIDSMPSVLVGVDVDGKVTQWNKTAEKATGVTARAAHGKILSDVFPHMASEMDNITESIQTREIKQDQKQPRVSENGTCYEDITIYPLITNGVEGVVIRVDDVTERVRMEEMMVQSEKMLSVGGLAAGMAHEINNPLAGIMQTADVLASRLTKTDMPANIKAAESVGIDMGQISAFMEKRDIPRMAGIIRESGRRVAEIVDNMLSFARKSDSQVSSHPPAELMDKTIALAATDYDLKKKQDFKTIHIEKTYEPDLPYIPCEGAKIQQVLLNIFRNGAQAMQEAAPDGEHCFSLGLSHEKECGMVRLEIRDNGPGMDEATRKRVFEPFFTTKPVGVGTGLGLSVSYFIITENHGGEMTVESTPGKGTSFIIRLPVSPKEEGL